MALRGEAAVVIWGELSGDAAAVGSWYAREHLPERLSIPGFLRGRYDPDAVAAVAKQFPAIVNPIVQIDFYQVAHAANVEDAK
jgi:hypothetical protein